MSALRRINDSVPVNFASLLNTAIEKRKRRLTFDATLGTCVDVILYYSIQMDDNPLCNRWNFYRVLTGRPPAS